LNKTIVGIVLTSILIFLILFAFFFVQGYFSANSNIRVASSSVENGLQLFMTLDANKTSFQEGEQIKLTLALTNLSNQTKIITDVNGVSIFNFGVYDRNNNWIYSYEIGAYPIINQTINIPPYANYNETFTWGQGGIPYVHPSQEPTGTYYIIGNTNDNTSLPYLATQRLNIVIKYPFVEVATVFLIAIFAIVSVCILLYIRHQKTANLNQQKVRAKN